MLTQRNLELHGGEMNEATKALRLAGGLENWGLIWWPISDVTVRLPQEAGFLNEEKAITGW